MTAIRVTAFGGMMPRMGKQNIPESTSSYAKNALLMSGELRGVRGQLKVADLRDTPYTIRRVYRIPSGGSYEWVTFDDATIDFLKGPLVNDQWDRYYYTSELDKPRMNTRVRLEDGDPGYLLGVPAPTTGPTITVSGGVGETVTRSYVYTFVSLYGEEGAPSPPTVASGPSDATWTVSNMETTVPDASERVIDKKRIYRTVTSDIGTVDYHFVVEIPLATTSYPDNHPTTEVGANSLLESELYGLPPDDLIGIVAHPNGYLVGFSGRDLHFSEPYLPHAWPPSYTLSTEDPIRGLGIFGTSIAVCTQGYPYTATGIRPNNITFTKAQTPSPCLSDRRGVVSMPFGVYYPTDTGLMLISAQGYVEATSKLITKSEWQRDYNPHLLNAVRWEDHYVAFYDNDDGFAFAPSEPFAAFVELGDVWTHTVMQSDPFGGGVFQVSGNVVYEWNPAFGVTQNYVWRSKEFVTPKPVNFSALSIKISGQLEITDEQLAEYQDFNNIRFQHPLNPLNHAPLNAVYKVKDMPGFVPPEPTLPENKQPFHGSPLYRITEILQKNYKGDLRFKLFADGKEKCDIPVETERMHRLPTGYKARKWIFELHGNVDVQSVKIAETGKELANV